MIAEELKVGSSEADIRAFLNRHKWNCGFDDLQDRFHCAVFRTPEGTQTNADIYVNKSKEFVRADVHVSYTYF